MGHAKRLPIYHAEEFPVMDQKGIAVGWHCTLVDKDGEALGGGCHRELNTARRIAVAEKLERDAVARIADSPHLSDIFLFENFPNTNGFAAGFERMPTMMRSIAEAVERWAWTSVIVQDFLIDEISRLNVTVSPIARVLSKDFDEIRFFEKPLAVRLGSKYLPLKFSVCLAMTANGIFYGSQVRAKRGDWLHPILEAWRNLKASQTGSLQQHSEIAKKVTFLASNKELGLQQVLRGSKFNWPIPEIDFLKEFEQHQKDHYVFRALITSTNDSARKPLETFIY